MTVTITDASSPNRSRPSSRGAPSATKDLLLAQSPTEARLHPAQPPAFDRSASPAQCRVRRLCRRFSAAARPIKCIQREAPRESSRQREPAPQGRHRLARSVRAGKPNTKRTRAPEVRHAAATSPTVEPVAALFAPSSKGCGLDIPLRRQPCDGDDHSRIIAKRPLAVIQRSAFRDEGSPSCPAVERSKTICSPRPTSSPSPEQTSARQSFPRESKTYP